ncbi:MAG: hypothetical protein ACE5FG_12765 [Myxococcota bacterium]
MRRACWTPLLLVPILLGFVLPAERILAELAKLHRKATPLRVEARLRGIGADWPDRITLELHPDLGQRVSDGRGGRWLIRHGHLLAGTGARPPIWVPPIELLVLREEADLRTWLHALRIPALDNRLARCAATDCFVIGGPSPSGELWLDKDRFEPLDLVWPDGRRVELRGYRDWQGRRFPSEISILDEHGALATLTVERVSPTTLGDEEFSPRWVGPSSSR